MFSEGDISKHEPFLVVRAFKEGSDELSGVFPVFGDVIDVDSSAHVDDQIECEIEAVMEVSPSSGAFLESGIKDHVFDG